MSEYPTWVIFNGTQLCVAPGCGRRATDPEDAPVTPRLAAVPTDLCKWHHDQFPAILKDLVSLWDSLDSSVIKAPVSGRGDKVASSGIADVASLWNPSVSAVLAELDDWTRFLVRTINRDRPLPTPYFAVDRAGTAILHESSHGLQDRKPRTALAMIARWHARWLSGYPSLGPSLLEDALRHRRAAGRALKASPVVRIHLKGDARCQHVIEENRWGVIVCDAPLVGILRDPSSSAPSEIVCSSNPSHEQISRAEWMDYAIGAR